MLSRASIRIGPLYHEVLADLSNMLSPLNPEIGMNGISSGLYPTFYKKPYISFLISSYLDWAKLTDFSSILFKQTIICLTPRVNERRACYLV